MASSPFTLPGLAVASDLASAVWPADRLQGRLTAALMIPADIDWTGWLGPTWTVTFAVILVLLCAAAWFLNLLTLPGNWIAVALLAIYSLLGPDEGRAAVGMGGILSAFVVALLGELAEFTASAVGASRAGASRRSTMLAVVGSMIGAVSGAIIGVPIPVVGSLVAAVLFGGIGATAGAMYGEWTDGKSWKESWSIGHAAFWGRTFGVFGKSMLGLLIVLIAILAVLF